MTIAVCAIAKAYSIVNASGVEQLDDFRLHFQAKIGHVQLYCLC